MDRKTFIKDEYSKFWLTARDKIYGFMDYDRNLCEYICKNVPTDSKLLEVAIGTGYPFADYFQKHGYQIYGIDISPLLVEKCKQINPQVKCSVGDAENLDFPASTFDCTYCFHSTWLFPDVLKVLSEMLRVTSNGGYVIFDIQNRNNPEIEKSFSKHISYVRGAGRLIRYGKNIVKIILNKGVPRWGSTVWETPTYPEEVYKYLNSKNITDVNVFGRKEDDSLELQINNSPLRKFKRLVFAIRTPA